MKHWCVWVWFTAGLFMACSSENQWLDTALNLAGDNRAELQKVLDRYKEEDGDKYRAACFLIENMPFHGAYEGKALENYRKYFSEYVSFPYSRHVQELIDSLKRADGEFSINQLTYKRDIMTVDSAFLVNHIEWAFKVWREQPWGKHVDFDTFCEYILPYRIGDEPLSLWRKEIYECYSPILDEFRKTDEADNPKVAAQLLMDTLRKANYRNTALFPVGPHLGPDVLKWHTGSCREFTDAMIYVLRALGIPCGVDRVMVLGDNNASHFWNFVLDKEGKTYIANLPYEEVWSKAEEYSISRGKMYRATYSIDKEAVRKLGKYSDVYPAFRRPFFRDVTALYTGSRNWTVALPDSLLSGQFREGDMVYLCLANRLQWQPIGYTFFKKREAPYRLYTVARLKSDKPYRYMRYKGADGCFCNISELAFYENTEDTIPLYGEIIGTPGSFEDNTHEYLNAFDGNPDTSFDYIHPDGGWTGMDFGSPHRVEKVVYTPRNEVNFIYKGNLYELFYWGGGKWNSVGRQMAVSDSIVYSGFQGALFYLKNHTAGKDERIFEYKDGKQIFW